MLTPMATLCPNCREDVLDQAKFCHACGHVLVQGEDQPVLPPALVSHDFGYAPVWRRLLASIIDVSLLVTVVLPGVIAFFWVVELVTHALGIKPDEGRSLAGTAAVLLWFIADWLYHAAMQSSSRQGSLGKQFMGIKVTDLSGERVGFGQASGRHFAKFLSTFALMIGFFIAPFTRRKQALHDMVAGTLVLRR